MGTLKTLPNGSTAAFFDKDMKLVAPDSEDAVFVCVFGLHGEVTWGSKNKQ